MTDFHVGQGRALDERLQRAMSIRLGHDLSKVRIHDDTRAANAARAIRAKAFTQGQHIVGAPEAINVKRPGGLQTLSHELVHVVQQSAAPDPATLPIRKADFFESISRSFGGGTFTQEELVAYLAGLEGVGVIEDEYDSDNKANAVVEQGLHREQGIPVRILLIREMLSGHLGGGEERSILAILEDADASAREQIVDAIGAAELRRRFDSLRDQLNLLLRDIERGRSQPIATQWRLAYGTRGAESLRRPDERLQIVSMVAEPSPPPESTESAPDPIPIVSEPISLGGSGAPQHVADGIDHPRDMGGVNYLTFNVGGTILGANTDRHAPYAAISRGHDRVTALLNVTFGSERRGERSINFGTSTTTSDTHSTEDTGTSSLEVSTSASAGRSDTEATDVEGTTSRTIAAELGAEVGRTRAEESTDTSSTETSISLGGVLSQELRGDARLTGGAQISGSLLGLLLGLAGPEGLALYEILNALGALEDTNLTLGLEGEAGFTLRGELHGDVARRWTSSHTESERTETSGTVRGGVSASEELSATAGRSESGTDSSELGRSVTDGRSASHVEGSSRTEDRTDDANVSLTEDTLVPVIQDASLEIRVE